MNKKIFVYILFIILGAALGSAGYYLLSGKKAAAMAAGQQNQGKAKTGKKGKILFWRAPMNPSEIYHHPGKSSMGMDLVPVYADQAAQNGVVSINPVVVQDMNVKTTVVKAGHMHADVMTNGIIQPDEQKEYTVTTKAGGWIDKLYVNYTGQRVTKGQKLLRIYSPELVAAEQEYLTALAYDIAMIGTHAPSDLLKNATRKLELLDVSKADIQELKKISEELSTTLMEIKAGEKKLVKLYVEDELLQLSIHATEFLMRGEKYLLVSLQDIHPELEQKEIESWQMLIRVLTHEIMNSITPISSLASTVQDIIKEYQKTHEFASEEETEDLENIESAIATIEKRSKGLLNFVELYRNLTRIPKPHFRYFYIEEMFRRQMELMSSKIENQNIKVISRIFPSDLKLLADPDLIDQVMINLLLNAIDALKNNNNGTISLTASVNMNNRTVIEVADNGIGISQDAMDKVFMPFFTSKKEGSGIGLSLSRQIMQMHKGSISVRSRTGNGATFTLVF